MIKKICMLLFLVFILGSFSFAQFKPMLTSNGTTLETAPVSNYFVLPVSNGKLFLWDYDGGSDYDIKARLIGDDGNTLWEQVVSNAGGDQKHPHACETSDGKIIVVWDDKRNAGAEDDIYAKKFNSSGGIEWETRVTTNSASQSKPKVCPDAKGGAFIIWKDLRDGPAVLYAQYLLSSGGLKWNDSSVAEFDDSCDHKIIAGGSDKAWVCFKMVGRTKAGEIKRVRAQEIYSHEGTMEGTFGELIVRDGVNFDAAKIGDYIVLCWEDNDNIYEQSFAANGAAQWGSDVTICDETDFQRFPKMVVDGDGNSYVCWVDNRSGNVDIYIQKVNGSGATQWDEDGKVATDASGFQGYYVYSSGSPEVSSSPMAYKDGKIYIAWNDFRSDPSFDWDSDISLTSNADIFMQVISSESGARLMDNDLPVSSGQNAQYNPAVSASSPFAAWSDGRNGLSWQLFAQKVDNIPTQITGVTISALDSYMAISGQGFGADPGDIQNSDFTLGSSYNKVSIDGTTAGINTWSPTEIITATPYGSLLPGSHSFEVTAYGESDLYTFSVTPSATSFTFENVKFDGIPYKAGDFVTDNPTFEVKITSRDGDQNKIDIDSVTVEINGAASDVTQDFELVEEDILIKVLGLRTGTNNIKVIAGNIYGEEGLKNYTVRAEEAIIVEEFVPSQTVITPEDAEAAAPGSVKLAFSISKDAKVNIIIYNPAGQPVKFVEQATTGYNEVSIDKEIFYGTNGIYIIAIYDENYRLLGKTWITVRL